ncbi:hypothetical protein CDAR_398791 [Caerostris darwini]|uniref:Uncharacterized protein n=1 Tax=Caerostris darwini TaxID=1538125 RepID=A0AAV4SXL1_9ARAC|nr:hypothetical protein CDAR_398791 [Caerostris darwini]
MFFEVVVCAFIAIIAVLAILTLWRMKYSRFVSDNKHSVFQVLLDVMDSILFVTSGKKNALHLCKMSLAYLIESAFSGVPMQNDSHSPGTKIASSDSSQWKGRRKLLAAGFQSSMLKKIPRCLQPACAEVGRVSARGNGKEFTCVESLLPLCSLDIAGGELNDAEYQM